MAESIIDQHPPGKITIIPVKAGEHGETMIFHSICSTHGTWDRECERCNIGSWIPFEKVEPDIADIIYNNHIKSLDK